ncbi:MAG: hypothetical protein NVS1B7_0110 [Candidatus Saccharimonadales bacterium]
MSLPLNAKRVYFIMIGTSVLLLAAGIGMTLVSNSFLQKKSNNLVFLKLQYRVPEENQAVLKQAKADIQKYSSLQKTANSVVPQEKDQARTVREIINFASQTVDPTTHSAIQILSISFPSSNLGQPAPKPVPKTPGGANDSTPSVPPVIVPPVSQVQPVEGIPGVFVLPVTVESDPGRPVTFNQIVQFLSLLEQNRRTAQVNQISITPQKNNTGLIGLSFTVTLNVYLRP